MLWLEDRLFACRLDFLVSLHLNPLTCFQSYLNYFHGCVSTAFPKILWFVDEGRAVVETWDCFSTVLGQKRAQEICVS